MVKGFTINDERCLNVIFLINQEEQMNNIYKFKYIMKIMMQYFMKAIKYDASQIKGN